MALKNNQERGPALSLAYCLQLQDVINQMQTLQGECHSLVHAEALTKPGAAGGTGERGEETQAVRGGGRVRTLCWWHSVDSIV